MKVIPVYLPQFHRIPENDKWWGEGFTEWTNVRNAKPLFEGHNQPRVPLNGYYYDLTDVETLRWQAKIAKEHGIYGFCFYHYWFDGKLLLEKPMELLLENKDIDLRYCISWANENWTNQWTHSAKREILIQNTFDNEEDWVAHFNYMLPFFKDTRYMSENGKPIMVIYLPHHIPKLKKMLKVWNDMAIESGFKGLTFIYQNVRSHYDKRMDKSLFDYGIEFQPGHVMFLQSSIWRKYYLLLGRDISTWIYKHFGFRIGSLIEKKHEAHVKLHDYDATWEKILSAEPGSDKMIPSAFVDWDNTPRHKTKGSAYPGACPEKFKEYFGRLIRRARDVYHKDKIFVFAWNEWGEGGYLEPDETHGFGYLEAIREALKEENEWEE